MRMHSEIKGDGGGELLTALQTLPRSNVSDGGNYHPKESKTREDGESDSDKKTSSSKIGAGLFHVFAHGLKPTEQPGHNLPHQKNGNQRRVAEERMKLFRAPVPISCQREYHNQSEKSKRHSLRQPCTCLDPRVIDAC